MHYEQMNRRYEDQPASASMPALSGARSAHLPSPFETSAEAGKYFVDHIPRLERSQARARREVGALAMSLPPQVVPYKAAVPDQQINNGSYKESPSSSPQQVQSSQECSMHSATELHCSSAGTDMPWTCLPILMTHPAHIYFIKGVFVGVCVVCHSLG